MKENFSCPDKDEISFETLYLKFIFWNILVMYKNNGKSAGNLSSKFGQSH